MLCVYKIVVCGTGGTRFCESKNRLQRRAGIHEDYFLGTAFSDVSSKARATCDEFAYELGV